MNGEAFPELPNLENATKCTIEPATLKKLLSRTSFAVSRDDTRYELTGMLLRIANGSLVVLGTDGKRLARNAAPIEIDPNHAGSYMLPLKAVDEIIKTLDGDTATLYLLEDKVALEANRSILITKLINQEYPDIESIIPQNQEKHLTLHREELISLLRQISLFTDEESHAVRFSFTDGELSLSANTLEVGEGNVSMAVNYQGSPLEIVFNPHYFLDVLRHINQETVNLSLTDPYNPGVVTEVLSKDEKELPNPLFMLMPLRRPEE